MSSREELKQRLHSKIQYKRQRHPAHMKGRDIGIWYAKQNKFKAELRDDNYEDDPVYKKKLKALEEIPYGEIYLSKKRKEDIETLLYSSTNDKRTFSNHLKDSNFSKKFQSLINGNIENKFNENITILIKHDEYLDKEFKTELEDKICNNRKYSKFLETRQKLPCYEKKDEIIDVIWNNQVTLVSGETGCGKTTQIPQFILDKCIFDGNGSITRIICTQPRRISAISVSERVADERGENIGSASVGYQIRLERQLPRQQASITYCTTGVLLKQMESDPYLTNVSHIILDEIHERNSLCDFVITLLKQLITKRSDLKLILMSATFNSEAFAKYFNNVCGKIKIPGFTFPVKEYYLEDVIKLTKHEFPPYRKRYNKDSLKQEREYNDFIQPYVRQIESFKRYPTYVCNALLNPNSEEIDFELIKKLIIEIVRDEPGAILIFLPGYGDIRKLYNMLKDSNRFPNYKYLIIPLHSKMPSSEQKVIFDEPPGGMRKIIISTNIAETSITINDVVYVIDCGKIKINNYDASRNLDSLKPEWVSLANADQRRGRAGRVKPGVCYHLFTRPRKMLLDQQQKPEILRERLENVILQIKMLQLGNAQSFLSKIMDAPSSEAIEKALSILQNMNAIDSDEKLTPLGFHLAKLPMSPQMGKMVVMGSIFSCVDPILSIAASLDFKDAFQCPLGKEEEARKQRKLLCTETNSDHLLLHEALTQYLEAKRHGNARQFCSDNFLSANILNLLHDMKIQLADYLYEMQFISNRNFRSEENNINSENKALVTAIVAAGLYPNIAVLQKVKPYHKMLLTVDREIVNIVRGSVNASCTNFSSPLFIYYLKLESSNKIWLHDTTMIHPLPLLFFGDKIIIKYENETTIELPTQLPVRFKCSKDVTTLIRNLRSQFEEILEYKVAHPGIIDWTQNTKEVNVLRAIMQLITTENLQGFDSSFNRRNVF